MKKLLLALVIIFLMAGQATGFEIFGVEIWGKSDLDANDDGVIDAEKLPAGSSGDVVGPSSATDGHIAVFDGLTGKLIKDGGELPTDDQTASEVPVADTNERTDQTTVEGWLDELAAFIAACGDIVTHDASEFQPAGAYAPGGIWEKEFTIADPENLPTDAERATVSITGPKNITGSSVTITEIQAWADTDDYTFLLFKSGGEYDFGTANDVQIDSVACSSNGTACFYNEITSGFDNSTLEDDRSIIFQHQSGTANWVKVKIKGTF